MTIKNTIMLRCKKYSPLQFRAGMLCAEMAKEKEARSWLPHFVKLKEPLRS
jgi:hypothetical protein